MEALNPAEAPPFDNDLVGKEIEMMGIFDHGRV
jgi:hypothetical protein